MIVVTIVTVVVEGSIDMKKNGSRMSEIKPLNEKSFASALSFCAYAYEGIGVILPIQKVTADPENYYKIVIAVVTTVCLIYMAFGQFCCFAWGTGIT